MTSKYGPETRLEKVNISLKQIFKKVNAKKQHKVSVKSEPRRESYFYTTALPKHFDTESSNMLQVFEIQPYVYLKMKRSQTYL